MKNLVCFASSKAYIFKYVLLILTIIPVSIKAQKNNYLKDVTVNTPNAAALDKYGDIPVSNHSGVPNIGIPESLTNVAALNIVPSPPTLAKISKLESNSL